MCYNCSICLGAMVPDFKQQVVMLQCGHAFHVLCILGWLIIGTSDDRACPTCRSQTTKLIQIAVEPQTWPVFDCQGCQQVLISENQSVACVLDCGHTFHIECTAGINYGPWAENYIFRACPRCNEQSTASTIWFE